jgi:PKHD-type hydroxylase
MPLSERLSGPSPLACWPALFSGAECQQILAAAHDFRPARVSRRDQGEFLLQPEERRALTCTLAPEPHHEWLYQRLHDAIVLLNRRFFGFQLSRFLAPEVLLYEPGGFYTRHVDLGVGQLSSRKLSAVVLLSESTSFSGGQLQFFPACEQPVQEQGALWLFPAWLPHAVTSVTAGARATLVTWVHGPCFR